MYGCLRVSMGSYECLWGADRFLWMFMDFRVSMSEFGKLWASWVSIGSYVS